MILAAGYGTRLRPISYTLPKPMVPLGGQPLIALLVQSLMRARVRDIIVNLHHLPEAIKRYLPKQFPDANFHFSHEPQILGTGGGVRKVRSLLEREEDFFLLNGDTYQAPRFDDLRNARRRSNALAALTLRHPPEGDRYTAVWEADGMVTGFGRGQGESLMFSGSHCVSSRVFGYLPDRDVSDITGDVYQPVLEQKRDKIAAVVDDNAMWFDIGTPQRYLAASRAFGKPIGKSVVEGELHNSVVWDDCIIARGVTLESCIVTHGVEIRTPMHLKDSIICKDDPAIPRDPSYRFENGLVIACV